MSGRSSILKDAPMVEIDPNEIEVDISGRIGFYFPDKAEAFARLLAADGQRDPVKVSRAPTASDLPWRLHVGLHRTMGARIAGLPVYAIEVSGKVDELRDLESSENLHRRPIAPIERAKFIHALCDAVQTRLAREHGNLKQEQLAAKARWDRVRAGVSRSDEALAEEADDTVDKMSTVYGWKETAAEAMGLGKREIQRALSLYRLLVEPFPEFAERLANHPVVGENASQLRQIAQVQDEAARRVVIEALLADPEIGADDARILAGVDRSAGPAPAPHQKHFNAIEGAWARLGTAERKRFLRDRFVSHLTPGEKRDLRDRLNEELEG